MKKDYLEEIEGDMEEVFYENLENHSIKKSKRRYTAEVLKLLRPIIIKNVEDTPHLIHYSMLKNNLKIALRVLQREKTFAFINILGLAAGMAITILIVQYARFELTYENTHEKADRIVRITTDYLDNGTLVEQDCEVFPPLPQLAADKIPEVVNNTRVYMMEEVKTIEVDNQQLSETHIYGADPSFFDIFDYPLIHGNKEGLFEKPYEAVVTETTAIKYFGKVDVVGKSFRIPSKDKSVQVVGVIKDCPKNTHLKFNLLISYPTLVSSFGERDDNWNGNNTYAYLLLNNSMAYDQFAEKFKNFNDALVKEKKLKAVRFVPQPIKDIHLYSDKSFEPEVHGSASEVFFLLGVAFLVIIIAIVNYINLTTSKALDRAKEIGIRKVVGSTKNQIKTQFMVESFLINLIAGAAALGIIMAVLPVFKEISGLPVALSFVSDLNFWFLILIFVVASAIFSGIFPAFILSSFKPVSVLKGKLGHSTLGIRLRKGLVVFQFAITILLLVQTLTVREQLHFMQNKELGVNVEKLVVVKSPPTDTLKRNFDVFKNKMTAKTWVKAVSVSSSVPGMPSHQMSTTTGINLVDAKEKHSYNFYIFDIDAEFIPTMEMTLLAGENFLHKGVNKDKVIVNEEAVRLWGIPNSEEAIGKMIDFWGSTTTIIGVVKNFHHATPKSPHVPLILRYSKGFTEFASVKIEPGNVQDQIEQIKRVYDQTFAGAPFGYFFMDSEYERQYQEDQRFKQVFGSLTLFAIFIASLGLFGLASFTVLKRSKEIGIRKVLGAGVSQIIFMLSKEFVILVLVSTAVAIPFSYYIVDNWLNNFAFRIELNWLIFVLPALVVLLVAILSVSLKTLNIATSNPVDSLRDE